MALSKGAIIAGGSALVVVSALLMLVVLNGFLNPPAKQFPRVTNEERLARIPANATKYGPGTDNYVPLSLNSGWRAPVPFDCPANSAGAEDSPFITLDGKSFYFFFTPDVKVPVERQILDGVTGIWWTRLVNGTWTPPEKCVLGTNLSLDGCEYVRGEEMWFASVRAGNYGEIDIYTARLVDGNWTDVKNAGPTLNREMRLGEFHLSPDANTIYYGANRTGTLGGLDLWYVERNGTGWGDPVSFGPLANSVMDESQPFVTDDGREVWFTRWSAHGYAGPSVWRSVKLANGTWGAAEEMFGNFAGEPTLDAQGNVYFTHHFYEPPGTMLEADIYVAYKR